MPLHEDFLNLSRAVRPKILKLARQRRLVDTAFREFQRQVFPGAPPDQVHAMRVCFYAGAWELFNMQTYAADTTTDDPTGEDLELYSNIIEEIQQYAGRTLKAAAAGPGRPGHG